ncbi:glycosyltransferase family 2 protein [Thermomonas fusca]|uniref:Glycosyltransferase family 2 protein n=1 Tax=Thermomonas fusca TaxID=215690 RepID=A0A5R9PHG5_9GAMM|nr:glycosyltransferase family 2 protein [Thermomonas fusca]TLX22939.1 glycosyltransferase family 2 protein [Thermomonas fusca]
MTGAQAPCRIGVVIPCFKVTGQILAVLAAVPGIVERIYCVDDACPEGSGDFIRSNCFDPRVQVLRHARNEGVGAAVMTGYREAISAGVDVIVKIDGDGQMDPVLLPRFVAPIMAGDADYTKGNRFYDLRYIARMPAMRLAGNAVLSFMNKFSTGYWDIFDPTNGYTAISARVASLLPMDRISRRYFFESDMLFRLGTFRAVVRDVPMDARYGDEVSNLRIGKVLPEFLRKHSTNFFKRIFYNYFLRDVSIASLELLVGIGLCVFGTIYGGWHWWQSLVTQQVAATGVIMLAAMPVLVGLQLLLAFLAYDIAGVPRNTLTPGLRG